MANELGRQQITDLYAQFRAHHTSADWLDAYLAEVSHFRRLSEDAFRSPTEQARLWSARGVAKLGPGEAMSTRGAESAPEIVDAFSRLRSETWPEEPAARGRLIQKRYDEVLDLVHPRYAPRKPQTKLGRAFAALVPAHTTTCLNFRSYRDVVKLVLGSRKVAQYEGAVLVRERLRTHLGRESGPNEHEEHVRRSMFCWWLHQHVDSIRDGLPIGQDAEETTEDATLEMWPASRQRRGITSVRNQLPLLRTVVSLAQNGVPLDDLITQVRAEVPLAQVTIRAAFNTLRWFGFLRFDSGLWAPSEDGEELLECDPPEILVERLLTQVFGPAWVVRGLATTGPQRLSQIALDLRERYPAWTADTMASHLCMFLESLGLIEGHPDGTRSLTEYGRAWANQLPAELPIPELLTPEPVLPPPPEPPRAVPSLDDVLRAFRDDEQLAGFVFDDDQVSAVHWAWHCDPRRRKRFVLLSGLSGTGKTALLVHYARIYTELIGGDPRSQRALVAVSPDWRDPSGLLGYLNRLHEDPTFHPEPALRLVLDAAHNPDWPYFLILDEMNLARVERYFAPFLSAMETGEDIVLHAHDGPANDVPPRVPWPGNLFIGGTVNMDETTHPFSDKVLDRAFTFEFYNVDLRRFFERRARAGRPTLEALERMLVEMNGLLEPIRRHFGYRTAGEIVDFVLEAGGPVPGVVDQAVFSKVLPRLRGEHTVELHDTMTRLAKLCEAHGLVRCEAKVQSMASRLERLGVTGFWS